MKLRKILAVLVCVLMTASFGILSAEAQQNTYSAKTNGQAAGAILKNLYKQYKSGGKIDLSNLDSVIQLTALANVIQGLKGQDESSEYFNDFTNGLVRGSKKLIDSNTAPGITKSLRTLADVDLSAISNATTAAINSAITETYSDSGQSGAKKVSEALSSLPSDKNAMTAVSTVSSILGLLGKK